LHRKNLTTGLSFSCSLQTRPIGVASTIAATLNNGLKIAANRARKGCMTPNTSTAKKTIGKPNQTVRRLVYVADILYNQWVSTRSATAVPSGAA
jgi:hypothetical protein